LLRFLRFRADFQDHARDLRIPRNHPETPSVMATEWQRLSKKPDPPKGPRIDRGHRAAQCGKS